MASRRFRARRTLGKNVDQLAKRLRFVEKNTGKKRLNPRVVTTTKLYAKTVTTPKIADNAVTTEIIAANAVTTTEIAPGAVTTTQINFDAGDIGGMASSVTTTAPTGPNVGDIWFDASDNNNLKRWSGTAWVSVRDATIAVAQSAANAAQTTADGKNKIYRQGTNPGSTGNTVGDLWFDTANDNRISRWDGSAWTAYGLGNAAIANLDAGKITTGSLDAGRIAANTINASMIIANSITSTKIAADAIDGKTITGAVIQTSNAAAGKIIIDSTNGFRGIASNGVTTVQITTAGTASFNGSVTATSFTATGLVNTTDLVNNAVTSAKIADNAVGTAEIADLAITNAKVNDLSANKINAGTINAAVISVTNLNASNITAGSINAAVIGVTNLNASNITAGSIDAGVISVTNINASNITTGTITGRTFQSDTLAGPNRTVSIGGGSAPKLEMYDTVGDQVTLSAFDGLFMKYKTLAVSTKINLTDPVHRLAIDTTNATYALEVGGSIRCTSNLIVGGSISGSGIVTNPLGTTLNANSFAITNVNEVQCEDGGPADPSFTFTNSTTTGIYYDGDLNLAVTGISRAYATATGFSGGVGGFRSVNPNANTTYTLGTTSSRWLSGYVSGGLISSSDMRIKNNIQDSNLGLDFIEKLRPVSYRMNEGQVVIEHDETTGKEKTDKDGNVIVNRHPGRRPHYGFIAQEVKQAIDELGVDFAGWTQDDLDDPDSYHSLRYDEFISPAIKAVQELSAKVKLLEARIQELEG